MSTQAFVGFHEHSFKNSTVRYLKSSRIQCEPVFELFLMSLKSNGYSKKDGCLNSFVERKGDGIVRALSL